MAKKAQGKVAKTKTIKARPKNRALAKTAKPVGRTKVKAAPKKSVSAKRSTKKPKIDPEVEATRARNRALWKSQEKEAMSAELARHGTLVDERARVRSHIGMSWSNRKPR